MGNDKPTKRKNYLVWKANKLIEARYKLSLNEQKFVLKTISKLKPTDENFGEYVITVDEFYRILGLESKKTAYRDLKRISKSILKKPLTIPEPDGDLICNWFSSIKYKDNEGFVMVSHDPKLIPYLLMIQEKFTAYKLENILHLRSAYSIRIYELLRQYLAEKVRTIPLTELRELLGIEPKQYSRFNDFKRFVLDVAKKELPKQTDIGFTWAPIKTGRKITAIKFKISTTQKTPNSPLPDEALSLLPKQHRTNQSLITAISKALTEHDVEYVIRNIEYSNTRATTNYPKYLKDALANGYAPEPSDEPTINLEPGMTIVIGNVEYVLDPALCIWRDGGCMPTGDIREAIRKGSAVLKNLSPRIDAKTKQQKQKAR